MNDKTPRHRFSITTLLPNFYLHYDRKIILILFMTIPIKMHLRESQHGNFAIFWLVNFIHYLNMKIKLFFTLQLYLSTTVTCFYQ